MDFACYFLISHLDALVRDEKDGGSKTRRPIANPSIGCFCKTLASSSSMSSPRSLKAWLLRIPAEVMALIRHEDNESAAVQEREGYVDSDGTGLNDKGQCSCKEH